jgi:hypothetical protein
MNALIDLNVMLDFLQRREPFFEDAADVMDHVNRRLMPRASTSTSARTKITIPFFICPRYVMAYSIREAPRRIITCLSRS